MSGIQRFFSLLKAVGVILLVLLAAWLGGGRFMPESVKLAAQGLAKPVEIIRDRHAVPHVYAESIDDAYFALGFLHAQDRLWQMDLSRRAGSGRLAEVFGLNMREPDRFIRTLGLRRAAAANLGQLDAATLASLHAYAKGVNAYLGQSYFLPIEFYLTGAPRPEPWQPADSLVWLKTLAWRLSGNWWEELLNLRLQGQLSPAQFADLFPPYPGEVRPPLPDVAPLYHTQLSQQAGTLLTQHRGYADNSVGSNSWVVDGGRGLSGKPLLANDPHLPLTAPSLWYFAHLHAPGLNVVGASLPGVPGILLGRNDKVAWAFTNTGPDSQDVFVEKLVDGDFSRHLTPQGAASFTEIQETLRVKDAPDENLVVRIGRHGPVISAVDPDARDATPQGYVLALNWVGLRADDMTIRFLLKAGRAENAEQLKQAARDFHTPQQNIVYADRNGAIGFVAAGRVPLRAADNDLQGRLPAPGWLERYDWQGLIPFEQLPQQSGGSDGKIVTANQKITAPGYPHFITADWALPYRAERISALLDQHPRHDVDSFAAMQNDLYNPVAAQLLPLLLRLEGDDDRTRQVLHSLRAWDRRMSAEAAQPLVFAAWLRHLMAVLSQDELGDAYEWVGDYNPAFLVKVLRDHDGSAARWCQDGQTTPCLQEIRQAFQSALAELRRHYGHDPKTWLWGRAHVTVFKHEPLGQVPGLARFFNVEAESPGGMDTVNVSGYRYDETTGRYRGESGAAFRAIYDLAEPDRSVFILGTGQSGSPWSRHYRDMNPIWLRGGHLPLLSSRERIAREAVGHLRLLPE